MITPDESKVATKLAVESSFGESRHQEEDRPEKLRKRALVYSGVGSALFVVFLSFAARLYFFQSIRLANIAFVLAFIGLLLFVTLTGIAFLTVFDMRKNNYKEDSQTDILSTLAPLTKEGS